MLTGIEQSGCKTGIDVLDNASWGSHFCLFYETKEDLTGVLTPYFKAGLEGNEFCMWITSGISVEEAEDTLRKSIPDFDLYAERGQIRIIPHSDWYLKDGVLDSQEAIEAWADQLNQALASGFAGMRVTGNGSGLESEAWKQFAHYERQVDDAIGSRQMIAICSYRIDECGASEIIDVVNCHDLAIIRREGEWKVIESTERMKTEEILKASENKYRTLVENLPQRVFLKNKDSVYVSCNENFAEDRGIKAEEIVGKTDYDFYPWELAEKYRADDKRVMESGETEDINEKYFQNGRGVIIHTIKTPVRDEEGNITGVLGIFWDITAQRRAQKRLLAYQKRLRELASEMSMAEERERKRLAIELHDHVTQNLVLFKINLGGLRERELPRELTGAVDEIYTHLDRMIEDMRSLTFDLGCPTLYELGLEAAVREYLNEEIQDKHGIKAEFEDDAQPKSLDDDVCALVYRAVRELLINVVKHARARHVKVSIRTDGNRLCVNVIDDGIGFKPPTEAFSSGKNAGFGLFSIRERLSCLGGRVEIESEPGMGTRVTLAAPMKRVEMPV
jgi:PAS domain S-box-containing protein